MSIPCACGSGRGMLSGVAGRQVWRGGWDEANIPILAPRGCPASLAGPWLRVEATQRPDQAGSLPAPCSSAPARQGCCGMGEAGMGDRSLQLAWICGSVDP